MGIRWQDPLLPANRLAINLVTTRAVRGINQLFSVGRPSRVNVDAAFVRKPDWRAVRHIHQPDVKGGVDTGLHKRNRSSVRRQPERGVGIRLSDNSDYVAFAGHDG